MRKNWLRASSWVLLGELLVVNGFVQSVQTSSRPISRTNPRQQQALATTDVPVAQVSEAPRQAGSETEDSLLPFRHSSAVYIEMTDMYGIVYHANYLTYAQRAIERAFGSPAPRIHSIHDMKYRAAATIGELAIVEGNLISHDSSCGRSRWRFQIAAADPSRVFVSAEATLSWPGGAAREALPPGQSPPPTSAEVAGDMQSKSADCRADVQLLASLPNEFADSPKTLSVTVWSDDLERGESVCNLSIRAVLNYFERIRTLSLGRGPDGELGLVRLHREGISIVVTNISDLRVDSGGVAAGDNLEVRLGAKLTRGNRAMTMYQTLWREDGTLLAHAEIALLCMDNETRKFRSVPPWVQDILTVPSNAAAD